MVSIFIFSGCSKPEEKELTDAEKFKLSYPGVVENNNYKYINVEEVITLLESGTGVLLFGFDECPWCQAMTPILDEAAKEKAVSEIYYFNPKEIRANNTAEYQKIVEFLSDYLTEDEDGNKKLYVPEVIFLCDGQVTGHNLGTLESHEDPNIEMTDEQKAELKDLFKTEISKTCIVGCDC